MNISLPLDLTGNLVSSRLGYPLTIKGITTDTMGETISTPYGLFHSNVTLILTATNTPLIAEVDYTLGHVHQGAFFDTGVEVFDSVVLLNPNLEGKVMLYANYLGGEYITLGSWGIPELISLVSLTKRAISWATLKNRPLTQPPTDHLVYGEDITTGGQAITGQLWKTWTNKRLISPELIYEVAKGVLRDMQPVEDLRLHTNSKLIPQAINELYARGSYIFGGGGTSLDYLGTLTGVILDSVDVSVDGYYLVGDALAGSPVNVPGMYLDGSPTKSLPSGTVLGVIANKLVDITLTAGPYGLAQVTGGTLFNEVVTFKDGINRLYRIAQPNTPNGVMELSVDTDVSSLNVATDILCLNTLTLRGRWKDTTWVSGRLVAGGTVVKFKPATGLELSPINPMRANLKDLPLASTKLNTNSKVVTDALTEVLNLGPNLDYASGDLITVVKDTVLTFPAVKAGSSPISRIDYPNLFSLWGTTYDIGDGTTTFGVPKAPSLGGSILTNFTSNSPIINKPMVFDRGDVWLINHSLSVLTLTLWSVNTRTQLSLGESSPFIFNVGYKVVGISGDLVYFVAELADGSERGIWHFNVTDKVMSKMAEVTDIVTAYVDSARDMIYCISPTRIMSINMLDNTETPIISSINLGTVNIVDMADYANILYIASSDGLIKVNLNNQTMATMSGHDTINVVVAEDLDLVLMQTQGTDTCLRFKVSDDEELNSSIVIGLVVYHKHHRSFRSISTDSTKFLGLMIESPIYDYYFKE
jgi:hypothetical protein